MKKGALAAAPLLVALATHVHAVPFTLDGAHVCAADEGKGACGLTRVRMCGKDGGHVGCACAPGTMAEKPKAKTPKGDDETLACVADASASVPSCIVPNMALATTLAASLELGELEVPSLPTMVATGSFDTIDALDAKMTTASAEELIKLALAHESVEGGAAYDVSAFKTALKIKEATNRRHKAVTRAIDARRAFLGRFASHARANEQRVALARALLRRAAYAGTGATVAVDRGLAQETLAAVIAAPSTSTATRDAAFLLGEQAVRDKIWAKVIAHGELVVKAASAKLEVDDPPYLAAAWVRIAHGRLSTADVSGAKGALVESIHFGTSCMPRAECVASATAARRVIAGTWAANGAPARALAPVLRKGTMPRHERVRPMLQLIDVYAGGKSAACVSAAEEARAYEQLIR